jgi:hypothetical protein
MQNLPEKIKSILEVVVRSQYLLVLQKESNMKNTKIVTNKTTGLKWTVRLIKKQDNEEPCVEFYDRRCDDDYDEKGDLMGRFVSSYCLSTLMEDRNGLEDDGLNLCGYEPDWSMDAQGMSKVLKFIDKFILKFFMKNYTG